MLESLTKDSNKNISNIAYNVLNLPQQVTFSDGSTIIYSYAADGTKLRTVHVINGTTTQKDYCGSVIYENGIQKILLTEDGYVDLSASTPAYYYYLKDHQGNNRVVINSSGTISETIIIIHLVVYLQTQAMCSLISITARNLTPRRA